MAVRKRTWKTKSGRPQEAWTVDYVDQAGDRHIRTFSRKRDADDFHSSVNVEVKLGIHTSPSKSPTVAEAAELYLQTCQQDNLERTTLDTYRQHIVHIVALLGVVRLAELTTPLIRNFVDSLRRGGRSPVMVSKVLVRLGSILADAQERGLLAQNVVRNLKAKRRHGRDRQLDARARGKLKVGVDIPSLDEVRALIAHLQGRWRPLLLTAIFTGLRASELRALSWRDVDLKRGELHVRRRADRYNAFGAPKSAAGERTIPIPPILLNTLKQHRLASKHDRLRQRSRQRREHRQHRQSRLPPRAGRGRRRAGAGQSQVHRPAQPAPLLCELVHQPARRWRTRITAEGGADAHGAFIDHHDRRCVRSFVSSQRRRQRACCG
jgi:integrase